MLAPYADAAKVSKALFATESANMPLLGYGSKAFLISLIENAINISDGKVKGDELALILGVGKSCFGCLVDLLMGCGRRLLN